MGTVVLDLPPLFNLAPLEKPPHLLRHRLHGVQSLARHEPGIGSAEQKISYGTGAFFLYAMLHLCQYIRSVLTQALPASLIAFHKL